VFQLVDDVCLRSLRKETLNPEFYTAMEFQVLEHYVAALTAFETRRQSRLGLLIL
jgi:hypothetical protein